MRRRCGGIGGVIIQSEGKGRRVWVPGRASGNVSLVKGNNSRISGREGLTVSSGLSFAAPEFGEMNEE
jgi:hypothetical protein